MGGHTQLGQCWDWSQADSGAEVLLRAPGSPRGPKDGKKTARNSCQVVPCPGHLVEGVQLGVKCIRNSAGGPLVEACAKSLQSPEESAAPGSYCTLRGVFSKLACPEGCLFLIPSTPADGLPAALVETHFKRRHTCLCQGALLASEMTRRLLRALTKDAGSGEGGRWHQLAPLRAPKPPTCFLE